jgi:hypothetical protein
VLLISDRPLLLHGIMRPAGIEFYEPDTAVALELITRGVCRRSGPIKILYQTRINGG